MSRPALRVHALGPLRAWVDGAEIDLGAARQRAVFAVLATRGARRPVSRAELIEAVWGENPPASANGSVHTYVSGLRRVLEPGRARWSTDGLLLSDAAGYRLRLAEDGLDIDLFERLCREAGSADAPEAVAGLDTALSLWRGEALSGVSGPYAEALRARLAEARLNALEQRALGRLASGEHADLVPELTMLVRVHPLRERLWYALMLALHRGGRGGEALEAFDRVRRVLHTELSARPGPELAELHQRILADGPPIVPDVTPGLLSVRPPSSVAPGNRLPALRGRTTEQTRLAQAVEDAARGHGRAVWLEGVAGSGKSALLADLLTGVTDCHRAWGAAAESAARLPFQPLLDALGLGTESAAADRILARIGTLCASAPLILVIDDLHWADEATLLLWRRLMSAAHRLPLLLVSAARPVPAAPDRPRLRRTAEAHGHEVISLAPLPPEAVSGLAREYFGARPGPRLARFLAGFPAQPSHLLEMVEALEHAKAVEVAAGVAELRSGVTALPSARVITAVHNALRTLSEAARETLHHAAVLGPEFEVVQVAALLGRNSAQLLSPLEEALEAGVITESGTRLAFRHPMLRWALYLGSDERVRRARHRGAARILAESGTSPEQVARQLLAAPSPPDEWVPGWVAEHHQALAERAPRTAANLLGRLVNACPDADPHRETLVAARTLLLVRLGRFPKAAPGPAPAAERSQAAPPHPFLTGATVGLLAAGGRHPSACSPN